MLACFMTRLYRVKVIIRAESDELSALYFFELGMRK